MMPQSSPLWRRIVVAQIFCLMAVIAMPALIQWLPSLWGKGLYLLLAAGAAWLAIRLRRALEGGE